MLLKLWAMAATVTSETVIPRPAAWMRMCQHSDCRNSRISGIIHSIAVARGMTVVKLATFYSANEGKK